MAKGLNTAASGMDRLSAKAALEASNEEQQDLRAEQERLAKEEEEQRAADKIDLLAIIQKNPEAFPLECAMWNILIEMQRPKDMMGRFIKTASMLENEQYLTVVGRVLMCGPTALDGKTSSGIPLNQLTRTITTAEQLIGKFVIIQRYTGNDQFFAPMPGKKLRYITASEILGVSTMAGLWMRQ